jgi:hypothetical protein
MSSFTDTSDWKRKDGTTLVYSYEFDGKQHDGSSEMEPQNVGMQLERLSVLNETSWRVKDKKDPDSEAGFFTRDYITALGILDDCRLHAITLDENPNETSSRLDVTIYPAPLEKLQATSVADKWSHSGYEGRPEEGWLKDEVGRLSYHSAGEYHEGSMFSATVLISQEKFDALAQAIKLGSIRSARLSLLADLYHFGHESMGAGIRGHLYNYAILCMDEGTSGLWGTAKGNGGWTKARMQELTLEWSPELDSKMAGRRDEPDDDYLDTELEPVERDLEKTVTRLSRDVQGIRGRIENFYQAAILIAVILGISQVSDWIGF